jgi:hypothetical protein
MNVEIGTEAAQFLEKEYIKWTFVAVYHVHIDFVFYFSGTMALIFPNHAPR